MTGSPEFGGNGGGAGMQFAAAGIEQLRVDRPLPGFDGAQNGPLFFQLLAAGRALIEVRLEPLFTGEIQFLVEVERDIPGCFGARHKKSPSAVLIF